MATEKTSNGPQTSLTADLTSGATTIAVASGTGFPTNPQFRLLIDSEILLVTTGGSGSTSWTVTRGVESTTAAAHSNGALVTQILTAGALDQTIADNVQTGAYASAAVEKAGRIYLPSNVPLVLRDTGAAFAAWGPLYPLTLPPSSGSWTWVNQGSASLSTALGALVLSDAGNTANSDQVRAVVISAPATPYTITALILATLSQGDGYHDAGLCFRASGSGKLTLFGPQWRKDSPATDGHRGSHLGASYFSSPTSGTSLLYCQPFACPTPIWLRIADDGTNRLYSWSADGVNWSQVASEGRTSNFTADQVGLYIQSHSAQASMNIIATALSWLQG